MQSSRMMAFSIMGTHVAIVCGEPQLPEAPAATLPPEPTRPQYQPQTSSASGWGTPRPWQAQAPREPTRSVARPKYETSVFRRSIPFVTLCSDQSGRNLSFVTNLYLKMPESDVSLEGIIASASPKVDIPAQQLVPLDSGFLPLTGDDKVYFSPVQCMFV